MRTFAHSVGIRREMPLLVSIFGTQGAGKTYSALRLGKGMQSVTGGEMFIVDTEARRALHYADYFKFQHVPFGAPFGADDYIDVLKYCVSNGAKVVIVDQMTYEHNGPGGHLEQHKAEVDRMAGDDQAKRERVKRGAWIVPKANRARLRDAIVQLGASAMFIFLFRAKEESEQIGKNIVSRGFCPQGGDDLLFEMTASALLLPRANGVPTWNPERIGEQMAIKTPRQFDDLVRRFEGKPFCEEMGAEMARWAMGDAAPKAEQPPEPPKKTRQEVAKDGHDSMVRSIAAASSHVDLDKLVQSAHDWHAKKFWSDATRDATLAAIEAKRATLAEGA
jgi:hypothetical protein